MKSLKGALGFRILLFLSGVSCLSLGVSMSIGPLAYWAVLAAVLLIVLIKQPVTYERVKPFLKRRYCAAGTAVCALGAIHFFYRGVSYFGADSGMLRIILSVAAVIGFAAAIPFCSLLLAFILSGGQFAHEEKTDAFLCSKRFYRLCILISAFGIFMLCVCAFSLDIWYDEAFSLALIQHGYGELIALTAADVHPPLYYLILKAGVDLGHLFAPELSSVYVAKLVSVIPFALILSLIVTKVKKNFGGYVAGMCAVCLVGMSHLITYGVEIRMYSWALLFVFAAYLEFCSVMKGSKKSLILLGLYSLAAAYTHYFACVAAAFLYLSLLIYFIRKKREYLKLWCVAAVVSVIGYLPWLSVFLKQVQGISGSYWISDIGLSTIISYFDSVFGSMYMLGLFAVCLVCFAKQLANKVISEENAVMAVTAIGIPIGVMLAGIIVSLLIRPVFMVRYMLPGLACLWLGISFAVRLSDNKIVRICFTGLVFMMSIVAVAYRLTASELNYSAQSRETDAFFKSCQDAAFMTNNYGAGGVISEMSGLPCYLWDETTPELVYEVFGSDKIGAAASISEVLKLLAEYDTVYFVEHSAGITLEELLADGLLECEYVGAYRMGYDEKLKVYRLLESGEE